MLCEIKRTPNGLVVEYEEIPIEDYQVAGCMVLVKLARSMEGSKDDNYIDMLGYAAISGMLRTEENELYV